MAKLQVYPSIRRRGGRWALTAAASIVVLLATRQAQAVNCATLCTGAGTTCTLGTTTLDSPCVLNAVGKALDVTGNLNVMGVAPTSLTINADSVNMLASGRITARGGNVVINSTGTFASVAGAADKADIASTGATPAGSLTINAGSVDFGGNVRAIGGAGSLSNGGTVTIQASSIIVSGIIDVDGDRDGGTVNLTTTVGAVQISSTGQIQASGSGSGGGGIVDIRSAGPLLIGGAIAASGAGGLTKKITLQADGAVQINAPITANGRGFPPDRSISITSGSAITVTAPITADGAGGLNDYGSLAFTAAAGLTFTNTGTLRATNTGNGRGGDIQAAGAPVTIDSQWNVDGGTSSGIGGTITISPSGPGITLDSPPLNATEGRLSATGRSAQGGSITIAGSGNFTLNGDLLATAVGAGSTGGDIAIQSTLSHSITIGASSQIDTNAANDEGTISIGPACTVTVGGILNSGRITTRYHDTYSVTGSLTAVVAEGGNTHECRCLDAEPNGACDAATPTCLVPPSIMGAVNPPTVAQPVAKAPCIGCPNGIPEGTETCDDGNYVNNDLCNNACTSTCGNGVIDVPAGDECDDGPLNGDASSCCDTACELRDGEACDDGDLCTVGATCSGAVCSGTNNCAKAEMVLLIDASGSMGMRPDPAATTGSTRMQLAAEAADTFVDMFVEITRGNDPNSPGQGKVGVAQFPAHPWTDGTCVGQKDILPMTVVGSGVTVPALTPSGMTPLLDGLDKADDMFGANSNRAMILLSDGYHNCPNAATHADAVAAAAILDDPGVNDIDLYTVGLGAPGDVPLDLLDTLATDTDGRYRDATVDLGYTAGGGWTPGTSLRMAFKDVLATTFGLDSPADPLGSIAGQTTLSRNVRIISRDQMALFLLAWNTKDPNRLSLRVKASDGSVVSPSDAGVSVKDGDSHRMLTVRPEFLRQPGKVGTAPWTIEVVAEGVPAGENESYHYSVIVRSNLKMHNGMNPREIMTGTTVTLTSKLTDSGKPLTGLSNVSVSVSRPIDGIGNILFKNPVTPLRPPRSTDPLSPMALRALALAQEGVVLSSHTGAMKIAMVDDGTNGDITKNDGVYTARFTNTLQEGTYVFLFEASGKTADGTDFEREHSIERYVDLALDTGRSTVQVAQQAGARYLVTVMPRDRFGNYLGPDRPASVVLLPSKGKMTGALTGDGAGRYSQVLELPDGVDIKDVDITVESPQAVPPRKPKDDDCAFTRFFKELFHCDD